MENINENVLDLIDHIDSGDALEAEKAFNNILQSRVDELLDAYKQDVATNMFNTEECADCEEQNEEVTNEALKGGQHKIDANKNGKIDAHDFKLLRGRKTPKTERMDRALAKRVENNKKMKEEVELDEASYSAKKARAGKDIGKPGKMFSKIATKAARKYGKERGAKIAGAVLAKLRKKGK